MASSRYSKKTMEQYMRTGDKLRVVSGAELENPVLPNKGPISSEDDDGLHMGGPHGGPSCVSQ